MDHVADFQVSALVRQASCDFSAHAQRHLFRDNKWKGAFSRLAEIIRRIVERCAAGNAERSSSSLARILLASRTGATMVEFALVGPVFLLLTFAIVDNGLVLFTQTILDNATREAARVIMVGKVQMAGDTTGNGLFTTTLCANLGGLIPCPSAKLKFHVQSSAVGFSAINAAVTPNASGVMTSTGFSSGTPQNYVPVQVAYAQPN